MSKLALGIDIGTSGIRTAVIDVDGHVISQARIPHEPQNPDNINADAWWDAAQACIHAQGIALKNIGRRLHDITGICVDGTSGTMVLTDAQINPVSPALMYNSAGFDQEAIEIARHAPDVHITKGSNSALARALRLQSQGGAAQAVHLLHQADFIIAKLRGAGGVSDENNTLKLGFDPASGVWPDWFGQVGLNTDLLPRPLAAGAPIGPIARNVAQDLGFSNTTTIHAGTTDSIAAFLAVAPLQLGAAVTSLGTTLAIKVLSKARIDDPSCGLYSHKIGGYWLAGGASNTGGGVLAQLFTPQQLMELSARIDPQVASPLDYYPLLTPGERFPINDPTYPPRMTPRPASDVDFLHGLLDAIARIEAQCYQAIKDQGGDLPARIFTAGGGASNPVWSKIRARHLGLAPESAHHSEASVGAARLVQLRGC